MSHRRDSLVVMLVTTRTRYILHMQYLCDSVYLLLRLTKDENSSGILVLKFNAVLKVTVVHLLIKDIKFHHVSI